MECPRPIKHSSLIVAMLGASYLALATGSQAVADDTVISVARYFGSCPDASTVIEDASGEACIIQAILNAFNEADNGVTIEMRPVNWNRYYDQLENSYLEGTPPDVHILHRHRLHDFVEDQSLATIGDDLASVSIDMSDWEPRASQAVTIGDDIYGLPFDIHANLWHVNIAILDAAGLVGRDGRPIMPISPGELIDHAKRVKEATGKNYLAADFMEFPIGIRLLLSLLWQQGENIFDDTGVTVDTPEMRAAITTMTDLFKAGYADPSLNYDKAQKAFLDNEVAVLVNGTWAVELYDREASKSEVKLTDYDVVDFPTLFDQPATWADSHLWVIPASLKATRPEAYQAALKLLAWISDHSMDWARTGHLAARISILKSEAYNTLPHRLDYVETSKFTQDIPPLASYNAVHDILARHLRAVWGENKSLDRALADAQLEIDVELKVKQP